MSTMTYRPRPSLADEAGDEFRLLVAEIAEAEQLPWPAAQQVARARWAELSDHDPEEAIPYRPTIDWRFVAWCWMLMFVVAAAVASGLAWALLTAA